MPIVLKNNDLLFEYPPVVKPNWETLTTVDKTGVRLVTGHEKVFVSVCLANHLKLKPFIVFIGAKREVKNLQEEFKNQCSITSSANGWM